jgi:hypothetical protein
VANRPWHSHATTSIEFKDKPISACLQASTGLDWRYDLGGLRPSDFDLLSDLDHHQIFAKFHWT